MDGAEWNTYKRGFGGLVEMKDDKHKLLNDPEYTKEWVEQELAAKESDPRIKLALLSKYREGGCR